MARCDSYLDNKAERILYLKKRYIKNVDSWYKMNNLINPVSFKGKKIINKYNKILKNYFKGEQ